MKLAYSRLGRRSSGATSAAPGRLFALRALRTFLGIVGLALASPAPVAAAPLPAHSVEDSATNLGDETEGLKGRIQSLEARTDLRPDEQKMALDYLRAALALTESAERARQAADRYAVTLESAPETIAALGAAFSAPLDSAAELIQGLDLGQLQLRLASLQAEAVSQRGKQRSLEETARSMATRPAEARAEIAELRRQLDQGPAPLPANGSALLAEASRLRADAARQDLLARIEKTEQELLTLPTREAIVAVERDLAARQVLYDDARIAALQAQINTLREAVAARQEQEARETARQLVDQPAAVRDYARDTSEIRAALSRSSRQLNADRTEQESLRRRLAEITESRRDAEQILSLGRIGDEHSSLLRGMEKELPSQGGLQRRMAGRAGAIVEARIQRLQAQQELRRLESSSEAALLYLDRAGVEATPERVTLMTGLVDNRRSALSDRQEFLSLLIRQMSEIDALEAEMLQRTAQLRLRLDERLLWFPSASPLDGAWAKQLGEGVLWLAAPANWGEVPRALGAAWRWRPFLLIFLLASTSLLFASRRRIRATLEILSEPVGRRDDTFRRTLAALPLTLALALPLPLVIASVGWALRAGDDPGTFAGALGTGLINAGKVLLLLGVFQAMCRSRGLFVAHFGWNAQGTARLGRALRLLALAMAPVAAVHGLATSIDTPFLVDGIGRLGFLIGSLALALFFYRVFLPEGGVLTGSLGPESWAWKTRRLWFWGSVAAPLVLAALAGAGYYESAGELQGRLFTTGWISMAVIIAYQVGLRGVLVAGRRAAYRQADARLAQAAANASSEAEIGSGEETPAPQAEPEIDVVTVSQQTRALLRAASGIVLAILMWSTWKAMIPALGVFDDVVLWSRTVTGANGAGIAMVTLADLLSSLLVLGVTTMAARNLPGFMEVVLLERFRIDSGARYAVVTIGRYVIFAVGLVIALNGIGADWTQMQWIVAALGVGLGFGLQEIVANFISGIIILFERPVRVGDLISIGSTFGIVTRIRIRAITVTDPDNFEVLVPNKSFITDPVQNWSLTTPVTRLVVKVGIAYGSDVALAQQTMLDVAARHPNVLASPRPIVLFLAFGDSALDLELRVFVGKIDHRVPTLSDLHGALNAALQAAGIEIPFPQRDLHLRYEEAAGLGGQIAPNELLPGGRKPTK